MTQTYRSRALARRPASEISHRQVTDRSHRSASRRHGDVDATELQAWADALAHLHVRGLVGTAPAGVCRALAAAPKRYGVVRTGWWSP
jgi:hypothetical protein